MHKGIGASDGIGIGTVIVIKEQALSFTAFTPSDTKKEIKRFASAKEELIQKLIKLSKDVLKRIGESEAKILEGQVMILSDPILSNEIEHIIENNVCVEAAVSQVCDRFILMFTNLEDELMNQRAHDILDIKTRLLKILLKIEDISIHELPKNSILVMSDLAPSMAAGMEREHIQGIITQVGGKTSHLVILARALSIPAVLGVPNITELLKSGQTVIVDGTTGEIFENPTKKEIVQYEMKKLTLESERNALEPYRKRPTVTKDGMKKALYGNIGNCKDAYSVVEQDGEGIGLFRTEFLFLDRSCAPTEEEQLIAYKDVAMALTNKTIIIRTLDVGGDKEIVYLGLEQEENPFLGNRAIRFCLAQQKLLKTQLRAILRASVFGDIRIMIPMITCMEELHQVKQLIAKCMEELDQEGYDYNRQLKLGIMIETPSASLIADLLAKEVDFFSIGTNDLIQYTMAVDRGNAKVANLYSVYHPSVLRSIRHIIECAKKEEILVGMCGEAASDPKLIPLLIAFGLDEFSVSSSLILQTRKAIANVDINYAKNLEMKVMCATTQEEVLQILEAI